MEPRWLHWARRMQALSQNGLQFAHNPFDIERYTEMGAIAAEMLSTLSDAPLEQVTNLLSCDDGYATPKVDVRGVVIVENKILMVRELADGKWSLPGGWADIGDTPAQAVTKEIKQESGYEAKAVRLLAVYDRTNQGHPPQIHYVYKIFIQCELIGGVPTHSIETDGVGFFKEDNLPELSLVRILPNQISRMFELYRNPDLPADFD